MPSVFPASQFYWRLHLAQWPCSSRTHGCLRSGHCLSRLSRTAFDVQKYKDNVRERKERIAAELVKAEQPGGLTPKAIATIQRELKLL